MARERRDVPLEVYEEMERKLQLKRYLIAQHPKRFTPAPHDCWENVIYTEHEGGLGQAYYCSVCGELLQVG